MVKKLSRGQKAWVTRKANTKKKQKHKFVEGLKEAVADMSFKPVDFPTKSYTSAPVLTLCGQLEDTIMLLEVRISNSIAKINSLM